MFGWFKRNKDFHTYIRGTKKIKVNGVSIEIRKLNLDDHLAGVNILIGLYKTYEKAKPADPQQRANDEVKIRKILRDMLYGGMASPRVSLKSPAEPGTVYVDHIIDAPDDFARKIATEIMQYSFGKKN